MQSERWHKRQGVARCCGCWESSLLHLQGADHHTQLPASQGTSHHITAHDSSSYHITPNHTSYAKHRFNSWAIQSSSVVIKNVLICLRNVLQEMGLKKAWGSPNGAMRRGWKGITISRLVASSTMHIPSLTSCFWSTWHNVLTLHHYSPLPWGTIHLFPSLLFIPMITHFTSLIYCIQRHYSHRGSQAWVRPASILRPPCSGWGVRGWVEERRSRQTGHYLLRRCK